MMQRNVEAGHDLCWGINRAQNASIPSPLRAGGSASADHGVRLTKRTDFESCPSFFCPREYVHGKVYSRLKFGLDLETEGGKWLL